LYVIKPASKPEFAGWTIKDSGDNIVAFLDEDEFYITLSD
jgi:hypothetical protein